MGSRLSIWRLALSYSGNSVCHLSLCASHYVVNCVLALLAAQLRGLHDFFAHLRLFLSFVADLLL